LNHHHQSNQSASIKKGTVMNKLQNKDQLINKITVYILIGCVGMLFVF